MKFRDRRKKTDLSFLFFFFWLISLYPCALSATTDPAGTGIATSSLPCESGFIEIEPIHFYFHFQNYFSRLPLTSSQCRIWYTFQPADENSQEKPLFVFFNGGPCSATTCGLMSFYTSRWTLDKDKEFGGNYFISNPVSWTQLGNLLYIDARGAGFSYDLMDNSQDIGFRRRAFNAQNYNAYIDAADYVRTLLRFLDQHPAIQNNPVIIVGESYGGIRATVMLYMLLNYRRFSNDNESYQDPALVQEIQEHYNQVFPGRQDTEIPPTIIAQQFGHQILIQPALTTNFQNTVEGEILEREGSIIYQVAAEEGLEFIPCRQQNNPDCNPKDNIYTFIYQARRDYYMVAKPYGWLSGWFSNAAQKLGYIDNLNLMTGVDVLQIPGLYSSARTRAFRFIEDNSPNSVPSDSLPLYLRLDWLNRNNSTPAIQDPIDPLTPIAPLTTLTQAFGQLLPWDYYYLQSNRDGLNAYYNNIAASRGYFLNFRYSEYYGWMFLKNLAQVKTFITNAKYDIVVYAPAIPGALALHSNILYNAIHDTAPIPGQERPGNIILNYRPNAYPDIPGLDTRTIRFPFYPHSAHAVSATEPIELFNDVRDWLYTD